MFEPPEELTVPWCWYCGTTTAVAWHGDHVTPRSRGGSDLDTNKVQACDRCNLAKGAMTLAEYRAKLGDVVFAGERLPTSVIHEEPYDPLTVRLPENIIKVITVVAGARGMTVSDWLAVVLLNELDRLGGIGGWRPGR